MNAVQTEQMIREYTAADFYHALLNREPLYVLDVRSKDMFEKNAIEGPSLTLQHRSHDSFFANEDQAVAGLPQDREIIVLCAKGIVSQKVAEVLAQRGFETAVFVNGMQSWNEYYDVRDVVKAPYGRIVQVARPARGDLSFVLVSDGQAMVIDPLRHIQHYQQVVAEADASLAHVVDTHAHADHISGGPALAAHTGTHYYLHAYDAIHPVDMLPARIEYTPLSDEQVFQVGQFRVQVVWFPGHTLGQVNLLATAPDGASFLFTGDGLFLESFGRPDLGGKGETWTPVLYESMFGRLPRVIKDDTLILPAHFATLDEGDGRGHFTLPYAQVRQQNDALLARSKESFQQYVLANLPEFPSQYVEIKRVNLGLVTPDEEKASELETGKNACALSG